jgi:TctA family transporter
MHAFANMSDVGPAGGFAAVFIVMFIGFAVVALGCAVWWLIMLIEAVRVPESQWLAADQSKLTHVLLMCLLGIVGTIVYMVTARPALRRVGPI